MSVLQDYRTKGMIGRSSKYLVAKIIHQIDFSQDITIVQLGVGEAVFTREILAKMTPGSRLYAFEVNPACKQYVPIDSRLEYIEDSAEKITKYLPDQADIVISTLPFASLSSHMFFSIMAEVKHILKKGGVFFQYQYFLSHRSRMEKILERKSSLSFEFRNFPPAFVYKIIR